MSDNGKNSLEQQTLDAEELISRYEQSHIVIGKRTEKSDENLLGFKHVDGISPNEVAFLFLGGTGTEIGLGGDKSANGYLSYLEKYIKDRGIEEILKAQGKDADIKKSIGLYSIIYDFGKTVSGASACNPTSARGKLFTDYKQVWAHNPCKIIKDKVYFHGEAVGRLEKDTLNPNYVEELFNKAFLYRLCDENGKKLSVEEACKRVRNLTICSHCHGAFTFFKVEQKMQQKMRELGYTNEEREKIQKQLLCVAFSPDIPLGISKSTMISFVSSYDGDLMGAFSYNYNNFKDMIRKYNVSRQEIKPAYFSGKKGEFLLIQKIYASSDFLVDWGGEHNLLNEKNKKMITEDGKMFFDCAADTIARGIKGSLEGKPLSSIEELICGEDKQKKEWFQTLKQNGDDMWERIKKDLKMIFARSCQRSR